MSAKAKKRFQKPKFNSINKTGQEVKKRIPFVNLVYLSAAVNILVIIFLFIFQNNIPPEVPLFYGLPEGENQLAQKQFLALPSFISILIIIINLTLAYFAKDDFIKKTLIITGFAVTFLSVATTIKIALLVGSF